MPTSEWLINGSRDVHLTTAVAIYEMWKNHQNGGPVRLVITDAQGRDYITDRRPGHPAEAVDHAA